jgi:hypothetical protein
VVLAHQQRLIVHPSFSALLPEGVQRGSTLVVTAPRGQGATSLALGLLAGVSGSGGWCAVVGLPSLGVVAATQLGLQLERLALIPEPGAQWPVVVGALIDGVDMILVAPPGRATPRDARRLAARVRERGTVMVALGSRWPDQGDLHLAVGSVVWSGLGVGEGYLQGRRAEVVLTGRGAAARQRRVWTSLPSSPTEADLGLMGRWA